MRNFLLAGAALVALSSAAVAGPAVGFNYVGNIVNFTVTDTGTYRITASGAEGGMDTAGNGAPISVGAQIGGTFSLNSGDVLQFAVGGAGGGGLWAGGGGGGTFVFDQTTGLALVIAGGGGGGWFGPYAGGNGLTTTGGASGGGGAGGSGGGGGGDGLTGDGGSTSSVSGGLGFANLLTGGSGNNGGAGGFGGGGGGGGGSFNGGASQVAGLAGADHGGNGYATILETSSVAVPEPVSGALLGLGVLGIGFVRRYFGQKKA